MTQHDSGILSDSAALWDWNLESNRIHFSPRWMALVGCQDQEVGTSPEEWFQRVHPDDSAQLLRDIEVARRDGPNEFDLRYRLRHKNDTYRWMSCHGFVVRNEDGQAIRLMGSQSDVTVETLTDVLTGLPNRILFLDRLTKSVERAQRYNGFHFAALLIDLGRSGTPAAQSESTGDQLLTAVARRLETCLRVPDRAPTLRNNDLVARLQGDHFAVLLDGLNDVSHAKGVGDRILSEMLKPFAMRGREARLSASIGIAVSATGYTRADDVLRDAEIALLRAQMLGGSHCEVFDTAILKSEQTELQLEGELEPALARREFELYYQPIVSLRSNQVVGFEALVRWRHPILGMIAPLDFIPIAERTGLIVPLGNWILRQACVQLRAWHTSPLRAKHLWMSVNISSVQLRDPALVEQVAEALRASDLEPQRLVLELTEGVAMENPTAAKTLLMQLRTMGVRISIDDFGTGYSSLAYLRHLPLDTLKVDRSFVRGMETDKDTADIVGSLTAMAQQMGLDVVVEGIENNNQLALLRSLNCNAAQGYLFAKPLDATAATGLIEAGRPLRPEETAASPPPESRQPEPQRTTPSPLPVPWRSLAATVALVTAAILIAVFSGDSPIVTSPASFAGDGDGELLRPAASAVPNAPVDIQTAHIAPLAGAPGGGLEDRLPAPSSLERRPPAESATPATRAATGATVSAPGPPPQPPPFGSTSLNVFHLHRIGHCRGRLTVSRDGMAFVADEGEDAFAFAYGEFLHTLAENTLTVRSATRTYRFRAIDGAELHAVVESINRLR